MTPHYTHLGDAIRNARIARSLSQDELAKRVGAKGGRFTVIRWEQGLHKPTRHAAALVRELGLDPSLFEDEEGSVSPADVTQFFALLAKLLEAERKVLA